MACAATAPPAGPEACDDGNNLTETSCAYSASGPNGCTSCTAGCLASVSLSGPFCGDGVTSDGEACDDGNVVTETGCPYGVASCSRCRADCGQVLSLTGPVCGDGVLNGPEACDDGNAAACGTCNATCTAVQPVAAASGSLAVGAASAFVDGETFTLNDGLHAVTVFEFDSNAMSGAGHVAIALTSMMNAGEVADAIVAAVNAAPTLDVTAVRSTSQPMVRLFADSVGGSGEQGDRRVGRECDVRGFRHGRRGRERLRRGVACVSSADCSNACAGSPKVCN